MLLESDPGGNNQPVSNSKQPGFLVPVSAPILVLAPDGRDADVIRLVLDATRIIENALVVIEHEPEWRDATPFLAIRTRARIAENGH